MSPGTPRGRRQWQSEHNTSSRNLELFEKVKRETWEEQLEKKHLLTESQENCEKREAPSPLSLKKNELGKWGITELY